MLKRWHPAIKVNICLFGTNLDLTIAHVETFEESYKVHTAAIKGCEVRSDFSAKISILV